MMKSLRFLLVVLMASLIVTPTVFAGDFDWMRDFNIQAEMDPSGLHARLEARFQLGDVKIRTVIGNVQKPADAYMLLRLGEMSHQPIDRVIEKYKTEGNKGWGALAKSLGIKPGSNDFHALKAGQDLYNDGGRSTAHAKSKGKGKRKK